MAFDDKAPASPAAAAAEDHGDTQQPGQQQPPQRHGIRRSLLEVFDAPPSADGAGGGGLEEDPGRRLLALMRDMFDARTARAWLRYDMDRYEAIASTRLHSEDGTGAGACC